MLAQAYNIYFKDLDTNQKIRLVKHYIQYFSVFFAAMHKKPRLFS